MKLRPLGRGSSLTLDPRWIEDNECYIGLTFTCPFGKECPQGEHRIPVYWDHPNPARYRWQLEKVVPGWDFKNITISPSIDATATNCKFHGHVRDGKVVY